MVTKKTAVGPLDTNPAQSHPPYPVSPNDQIKQPESASSVYSTDLNTSPAFDLIDVNEARTKTRRDSDVSSHGTWDTDFEEDGEDKPVEVPKPLQVTPSKADLKTQEREELPSILKPGPSRKSAQKPPVVTAAEPILNPWANEVTRKPVPQSNNPYLMGRTSSSAGQGSTSGENVPQVQSSAPPVPSFLPPPPPPTQPPFHGLSSPPLAGPSLSNPPLANQPLSGPPLSGPPLSGPALSGPSLSGPPVSQPLPPTGPIELPSVKTPSQELANLKFDHDTMLGTDKMSPFENAWTDTPSNTIHTTGKHEPISPQPTAQQKWGNDDDDLYAAPPGLPPGPPPNASLSTQRPNEHLLDLDQPLSSPLASNAPAGRDDFVIPPPPPISTQSIPPQSRNSPNAVPDTPNTVARRQRSEHYQIKQINWRDGRASNTQAESIRRSPILTQNANGPCPLLALVNALILTTPANADTALVNTLKSREQVSLGLLLDAVFDELMSGRRGDSATELPDVSELYSFLLALHTGMNVNPRFVAAGQALNSTQLMNGIQSAPRASTKAGCFEETKEMRLYSTFNVPLIHGWLPRSQSDSYRAFERCAQTFEDAQNVQFNEPELEDKMRAVGLTPPETQSLQDIQTIKHFLSTWPTQLTDHGLETISESLQPGQFGILFRNDHFSTIYKEPTNGALMTLVTDAGYSSHEEIVWESLVDVNGAASEMFSGDFRTVSHNHDVRTSPTLSNPPSNQEWQTVQSRNRYHNLPNRQSMSPRQSEGDTRPALPGPRPPTLANTAQFNQQAARPDAHQRSRSEQEDHDLALALQLQEEEEAQQRQASEQRRREQELTEQFLSGQPQEGRPPTIPPRRGGSRQTTSTRPAVNRPDADDPDAPPTYEQSASDRPYREAGATARPAQGNPLNTYDALRRQQEESQSAYAQQSGSPVGTPTSPPWQRTSSNNRLRRQSNLGPMPGTYNQNIAGRRPGQAATAQDAEERCCIM